MDIESLLQLPGLSSFKPDVLAQVVDILRHYIENNWDLSMVQKKLKQVEGISVSEIPLLVRTIGPILMQESETKAATNPSSENATQAVTQVPSAASSKAQSSSTPETNAKTSRMQWVLGPNHTKGASLSASDKAKISYASEVQNTLGEGDALYLLKEWTEGGSGFVQIALQMPFAFLEAPQLIERFRVLTEEASHHEYLRLLARATTDLIPFLPKIPANYRRQICFELGELIVHRNLPPRHSPTREFAIVACGQCLNGVMQLPRVHGAPTLRDEIHLTAAADRPSRSTTLSSSSSNTHSNASLYATSSSNSTGRSNNSKEKYSSDFSSQSASSTSSHTTSSSNARLNSNSSPAPQMSSSPTPQSHISLLPTEPPRPAPQCGPSYTQRPSSYVPPKCSMRDALGDSVLNDFYHCAGSGSEGQPQAHDFIRNTYQEALFRLEEDALCVDIQIGRAQSTVRTLSEISTRLRILSTHGFVRFTDVWGNDKRFTSAQEVIDGSLLQTHIDTFRKITKSKTSTSVDPVAHFHSDPSRFITEMTRLVMFQADEFVRARQFFGKVWRQVFAKQYLLSQDHRVYRMKYDDKYISNAKAILSDINQRFGQTIISGREWSTDFLELLDFTHYRYSVLPHLKNTKSDRYRMEHAPKAKKKTPTKKKNRKNSSSMAVDGEEVSSKDANNSNASSNDNQGLGDDDEDSKVENFKNLKNPKNLIPDDVQATLDADVISLLGVAAERILSKTEAAEMVAWMKDTFSFLIRRPFAQDWTSERIEPRNTFFAPLQMLAVIRMFHSLHERVRLAHFLSQTFDSRCWDFARSTRPVPESDLPGPHKLFPYFDTSTSSEAAKVGDAKYGHNHPPNCPTNFADHPPTPFLELSTMFVETNPDYIAQWEAETSGVGQRLTRGGAMASTSLLLGGPPPFTNTNLTNTLIRQAAMLRNTPWAPNPFSAHNTIDLDAESPATNVADAIVASMPPLADPAISVENTERYSTFLRLVKDTLQGKNSPNSYEMAVLKLLGLDAYPIYTIPRLVTNMVGAVRQMMTLPGRQGFYKLWRSYFSEQIQTPPSTLEDMEEAFVNYRKQVFALANSKKFAEIDVLPSGIVTYHVRQLHPPVFPLPRSTVSKIAQLTTNRRTTWEAYVKSYNSPNLAASINASKRRVFLARNIRCQLNEAVAAEPIVGRAHSWDLATNLSKIKETKKFVSSEEPLFITIDPSCYKITIEPKSTDWCRARTRRAEQTRSSVGKQSAANSAIHLIAAKLPIKKKTKPLLSNAEIANQLQSIETIYKTELERADIEMPIELPSDGLLSSVAGRKSRNKNEESDSEGNKSDSEERSEEGSERSGMELELSSAEEERRFQRRLMLELDPPF